MLITRVDTLSTICGISARKRSVTERSITIIAKATDSFHLVFSFFILLKIPPSNKRATGFTMYAMTIAIMIGLRKLKNEFIAPIIVVKCDKNIYRRTAEQVAIVYDTHFFLNHLLFIFMSLSPQFKSAHMEKAAIRNMTAFIPNLNPKMPVPVI